MPPRSQRQSTLFGAASAAHRNIRYDMKCDAMTYIGTVKNGLVELPPNAALPDGTTVRVEPVESGAGGDDFLLSDLAVDADAPSDLSREHDHYIYGTPKRGS